MWFKRIQKTSEYYRAVKDYSDWKRWRENRNPDRYVIEVKCGMDGKHTMHCLRLLR